MALSAGLPLVTILTAFLAGSADAVDRPLPQAWDYAQAMKRVASRFEGRPGVVLHVGDSITYANPYSQWARAGEGKTAEDQAILSWMHTGAEDDTDGWWLARFDHPDGGRSYTACGGLRADELLAGGKQKMPGFEPLLETYRPQAVILMVGTNDASAQRTVASYRGDLQKAVSLMLDRGIIPILSTIPPHPAQTKLAKEYSAAIRELARSRKLPLIDYEAEILRRRPTDWNGTLLQKDDVHPTAQRAGASPTSTPTAEHLRNSGYLLRGWLSVRKVAEVKRTVLDGLVAVRAAHGEAAQSLRVPIARDTWFSNVGQEADGNNGGSPRLKLKSHQEMSLVDIDPAPLRGRVIRSATLHLRSTGEPALKRVTVGTFGADWVEGKGSNYAIERGSSTHRHRRHPDVPWTIPGSDLCSVILGQGGTTWRMADATPPDAQGWQRVAVDPLIVAARVAGVSEGLFLFDDTGTEWTRRGEQFQERPFPNRFVFSRDSNKNDAPYLTVELGTRDGKPPAPPGDLRAEPADLPAGEAWVSWVTPRDEGPAGTVGFLVRVAGKQLPRYLIPLAGPVGERVRMHLRDLEIAADSEVELDVRAVDGAGNVGPAAQTKARVSARQPKRLPPSLAPEANGPNAGSMRAKLGNTEVAIIDELDKRQPVTGEMIPQQSEGYLSANHLWNAESQTITLYAARNEFVAFQIMLRGGKGPVRMELGFKGSDASRLKTEWGRYQDVTTGKGPLPDPIVPLAPEEGILDVGSQSFHCEIYVPHEAEAGEHPGTLQLRANGRTLALPVRLHVWEFTLPDHLSFLPDMNCYDLPANERAYYRLAHRHRTVLNRVPYYQNGTVASGCAPGWDGKRLDWSAWDRRFGPYFDGSAFADLPRRKVPIEAFYLPLHENWPTPIEPNYNGDYWADRAFSAKYRRDFVTVSRLFAEHLNARGWHDTFFQCFFNGKNDYKRNGWSRGSSPWLLDEPASFQDFWALRFFGAAFHEGASPAAGQAKLVFRCDISRPEWQRDALDGLLDYNVVGGAMRKYHRIVLDRKDAQGQVVVEYGSTNAIEQPNTQPVGWSIDAWTLGMDGVLPWQTVGSAGSWNKADPLALFYPGRETRNAEPVPSVRLKAYRRGQQDVEYLTLLQKLTGEPRWAIARSVRDDLHLAAERKRTGVAGNEDAGVIDYERLRPQDLHAFRLRVGRALSEARPSPKRRLVELRTPRRDPARLEPRSVSPAR